MPLRTMTPRVPERLHDRIMEKAHRQKVSVNSLVVGLLQACVDGKVKVMDKTGTFQPVDGVSSDPFKWPQEIRAAHASDARSKELFLEFVKDAKSPDCNESQDTLQNGHEKTAASV